MRGRFVGKTAGWLCALGLLTLAGCQPDAPVRVGYVGGLTGRTADLGIAGRDGVVLAVEEINRGGGINGRRVELLVRDDRQDPGAARKAIRELINAGVCAIVGPMTSDMALAAVPLANEGGRVLLSPTVSTDRLSGLKDHFFRIYPTSPQAAGQLAEIARRRLHLPRVAVVYDESNRSHTEVWYRAFAEAFEREGGRITAVETLRSGADSSLFDLAQRLDGSDTDGFLFLTNAMDTAILCQQLRKLGDERPVMTSEWSATDELIAFGGSAVEGAIFFQTFDRDCPLPGYRQFRKRFLERFRTEPRFASVHGYDAANILFAALSRDADPRRVADNLLRIGSFSGVQAALAFTPDGDIRRPLFPTTVRNGRFVPMKAP